MSTDNKLKKEPFQKKGMVGRVVGRLLVSTVIIAFGAMYTMHLMKTSPKAKPRKKPVFETIVKVEKVYSGKESTLITGMGNVTAAKEIDLKPRVSGEVLSLEASVVPGGYLQEGDPVLTIDPLDYELVVKQLESDVAQAKSNLSLEMGNQRIAKKEFELLGEDATEEEKVLMLRIPQLNTQMALVEAAEVKLTKAKLDLKRTKVAAPFNAVVISRSVNVGAKVTESTVLAHLVGTDTFWVELALPVESLRWVKLPMNGASGSKVRIYSGSLTEKEEYRLGEVVRVAADLEEKGRMARIFIEVDDPLNLSEDNALKERMFLGSYVRAEIEGLPIDNVFRVQRTHLRDNDSVWIMSENGTLDVRSVGIVFKGKDYVLVNDGLTDGDRIIVSNIAAPVAGMPLKVEGTGRKGKMKNGELKPADMEGKGGKGE